MKNLKMITTVAFYGLFAMNLLAQGTSSKSPDMGNDLEEAKKMIRSYVEDYKNDRYASERRIVGVEVLDYKCTISVTGKKQNGKWEVLLKEGLPSVATYVYQIEFETLKAIYDGKINALTAQGKAFSSDYTPMSVREMEGFQPTVDDDSNLNAFSFHFWTKGFPEVIPFRGDATRKAHGSNFTIFYYEKGLRTAWYNILPGERVRDDAREQAAPFPMMGITISGTIEGEVDGERITVSEGNTVFIPANVNHKWWNESDEPVEVILIMFGKGA